MLIGLAALENTDWPRLHHAYGRATDTPRILRGLLTRERALHEEVINYLGGTIIHQDTPWTATAPVACVLAGLLFEETVIHEVDEGDPEKNLLNLRCCLAEFITIVADKLAFHAQDGGTDREELEAMASYDVDRYIESGDDDGLYGDVEAGDALFARSVLQCDEAAPFLFEAVCCHLSDSDPRMRACAAMAASMLAMRERLAEHRKAIGLRILLMARESANSTERASLVLSLNRMEFNPVEFLCDESPAVRMCAALADTMIANLDATDELINAINNSADRIDDWFEWHSPEMALRPRFKVLQRLLFDKPIVEFYRLAAGAEILARMTKLHFIDYEWGPLLQSAFPEHDGVVRTSAQRRFLKALVENAELWVPTAQEPIRWFKQAGLPYDRRACARRL